MVDAHRTRRWPGALVVLLVGIALTGCAQTPLPETPPPLSKFVVEPDGIPPLQIGAPVPDSTALVTYGEHTCPKSSGWITGYPQDTRNSSGQELDPFDIVTDDSSKSGRITDEFVWSRQLQTAKGIRVGSSLAAVQAAYPSAKRSTSYSTVVYAVAGDKGTLVIEVASHNPAAAGEWPSDVLDTVVWMHVIPSSAKVASIAGNNNAGPCPVRGKDPGDTDDDDD